MLQRIEQSFETVRRILAGVDRNSPQGASIVESSVRPFLVDLAAMTEQLLQSGQYGDALRLTSLAKTLRVPVAGMDLLRAQAFIGLQDPPSAVEALKEELRYSPDSAPAREMLEKLKELGFGTVAGRYGEEFAELLAQIKPYTMVPEARLHSLFRLARRVCTTDVPGNFVECGVAAGGSSALLAAVVRRYSTRERHVYSFDTFEGMPEPTAEDVHGDVHAEETGWGTGTCAAPEESLLAICSELGVADIVRPVKGLFGETLPAARAEVGEVAFLHMDGDWYESTRDILQNLYDALHPQALVQADDYGFWRGCRKAMEEFQAERGIRFSLRPIDNDGVWFDRARVTAAEEA